MASKQISMSKLNEKGDNFLKIVVVGDGAVGKTCMCLVYANNEFPQGYIPTIFENYVVQVNVQNKVYKVSLFDTAGQEGYDRLRILAYPSTNVFLLCFAVDQYSTFENLSETWIKEIRKQNPTTPIVIVGTKSDLRKRSISCHQGKQLAKQSGAFDYVECSALKSEGIKEVFDTAIMAALQKPKKLKTGCVCL